MKYAKIENGNVTFAKNIEIMGGKIIINLTPAQSIGMGYKEYISSPVPEGRKWYAPEMRHIETDTQIIQEWEYVKTTEPEYKTLVVSKIREKYDMDDEFSMRYKDDNDPDFIEYRAYVQECKEWAKQQIEEYNNA
jgi:hypothetical protein